MSAQPVSAATSGDMSALPAEISGPYGSLRAARTATLDALLIAAAEPGLDTDTLVLALRAAAGRDGEEPVWALAPAEDAGVVSTGGGRVVFATPELRELVYRRAPLAARLAAHRVLAGVLTGDDQRLRRAWHRAAALDGSRTDLAADLAAAAAWARGRAAYGDASHAMERAAELSDRRPVKAARLLAAADDAWRAGDPRRTERLVAAVAGDVESYGRAELLRGLLELRGGQSAHARDSLLTAARRLSVRDRSSAVRALVRAAEASYLAGDHHHYLAIARQASALRAPGPEEPGRRGARRRADRDGPAGGCIAPGTSPGTRQGASPGEDFLVDYLEGIAATFRGRHRQAEAPLRRVIARAPELPGPTGLTLASTAGLMLGDDAQALRLATEAAAVARAGGALSSLPQVLDGLVQTEMWLGNHAAVVAHATEGLELAERVGQPTSAGRHQAWLALVAGAIGDEQTCRARAAAAIELAGAHGLVLPAAVAQWALALLDLGAGRSAEAATRLRAATGRPATPYGEIPRGGAARGAALGGGAAHGGSGTGGSHAVGAYAGGAHGTHLVVRVMATPYLIEAAVQAGDPYGAQEALTVLERWAASTGSPDRMALAARGRALLAPRKEAFEHFAEAVELHRLGNSAFETARTRLLYGGALRRGRRPSAAREHLHAALEVFTLAGASAWAARARAELRAAGETVTAAGAWPGEHGQDGRNAGGGPHGRGGRHGEGGSHGGSGRRGGSGLDLLTPQQRQIALMVAEGATNREVAARLFLSPRTVEHHLRNIFTRLEVRSRVELARHVT